MTIIWTVILGQTLGVTLGQAGVLLLPVTQNCHLRTFFSLEVWIILVHVSVCVVVIVVDYVSFFFAGYAWRTSTDFWAYQWLSCECNSVSWILLCWCAWYSKGKYFACRKIFRRFSTCHNGCHDRRNSCEMHWGKQCGTLKGSMSLYSGSG